MKITDNLIEDISKLSKLKFDSITKKKIINDMNKIVEFINTLSEIDTNSVEPLIYLTEELNSTRKDVVANELSQNLALKNGPKKDSDYFKVPKVINTNL
jgi:aspartyl-tRNA(Asn)/glutamyl-tRNA(Gln) amidotransferase subunit C|tara:strand:- start:19392 stop:19688 length:297 start_codon:yes stop_codon:yes gene_type:complete